ncbi:MAG TPA: PhzF family phenazine biosynthesis protein [Thermoanaerobaculia bacterium]|nr:PhzF family phenazine biosynthesis protein [Thermoanaerobaculia bacterium]
MRYRYLHCDVFTDTVFGGNPLAVLPDARGLSDRRLQQVAREFNFSETAFVLPAEAGNTRRVRIFTPSVEVPFAGHPNVGTAFALAATGELGPLEAQTVTFEEKAGLVPIRIEPRAGGAIFCELSAPQALRLGAEVPAAEVAAAVSLSIGDVRTDVHAPRVFSVGLPFLFAELVDAAALARARSNAAALDAIVARGVTPDIHLYVRSGDAFDVRARMFAPLDGVPEDPATGSANAALAAALAAFDARSDGDYRWRIAQGVEMGRPSLLEARVEKRGGAVVSAKIGGTSVLVAEGWIEVP